MLESVIMTVQASNEPKAPIKAVTLDAQCLCLPALEFCWLFIISLVYRTLPSALLKILKLPCPLKIPTHRPSPDPMYSDH